MDSDTPIVTEPEFLKRITVRTDVDVCASQPERPNRRFFFSTSP